jgi:hypothetical protein
MHMPNITLYPDTETYIKQFYEPSITAYRFLRVFFAELYENGIKEISRDLVSFFSNIKGNPRYHSIMHEFTFRSNGIFLYSNELEDNIFTLQNMGLLGKENPSFGRILIKYNDSISQEIINATQADQLQLIQEIASIFVDGNPDLT